MPLKIRDLRIAKGMSQQDLADLAGISRSQLSEIETEAKPGTQRRLASIARSLGVTVPELFSTNAREAYRGEIQALMDHMSAEDRLTILRMARALAADASKSDAPKE